MPEDRDRHESHTYITTRYLTVDQAVGAPAAEDGGRAESAIFLANTMSSMSEHVFALLKDAEKLQVLTEKVGSLTSLLRVASPTLIAEVRPFRRLRGCADELAEDCGAESDSAVSCSCLPVQRRGAADRSVASPPLPR